MDKRYINTMSGYEFENYCVQILQNAGFYNTQKTKLSGDFGIDIIAERNHEKIGIQCKRYSTPVGVQAVQQAVSGSIYYKCDIPMVLSNQIFTPQAMEMARKTNTLLIKIEDLIKIAQNPNKTAYEVLVPSNEELKQLALNVYIAFKNNGILLNIVDIQVGNNETIIIAQKEESVRLNKIFSIKNEVAFCTGKSFEIDVDYEKQCILLTFNNRNITSTNAKTDKTITPSQSEPKNNFDDFLSTQQDCLLYDAGKSVITKNKTSVAMLQCDFKISFNRALDIMNQLERMGVVSKENWNNSREVLMSIEEFESIYLDRKGMQNKKEEANNNEVASKNGLIDRLKRNIFKK